MQIEIGSTVVALGRYFGRVVEVVPVQSYDGYSVAVRVKFQREVEPSCGWFLGRDVMPQDKVATVKDGESRRYVRGYTECGYFEGGEFVTTHRRFDVSGKMVELPVESEGC